MNKEKSIRLIAYLVLVFVLLIGVAAFLLLPPVPGKKEGAIIGLSGWYFVWGLWYQRKKDSLNLRVALEYLLVAVFGAILLFSLI
ncbi:MAG: hypothetical protein PHX72_02870 [Candidatus Shapirobacteria bacterium]|nr:hypothetical protein [Candidatus Shapirobacteria bacterium]